MMTIQMKPLCLYFHMMLFASQTLRKLNLEIGRNLPLATFGSERVMDFCGTLITAGRCKKIRHRLRSQPERDKCFAALNYFFMGISL